MIDDDTLILYRYRLRDPDEAADALDDDAFRRVGQALAADAALAERFEALARDLDTLEAAEPESAPPRAVAQWHRALDAAAGNGESGHVAPLGAARGAKDDASPPARTTRLPPVAPAGPNPTAWLAGLAAVLALGVGIGIGLRPGEPGDPQPPVMADRPSVAADAPAPGQPPTARPTMTPAAFTRGLAAHMADSRGRLAGLSQADADRRAELIADIIEQNHLFQRAARDNGADDLARVLRAFEQTLARMAEGTVPARQVDSDTDRLSFEMAAMLTRLAPATSYTPNSF